MDFSKKSLSSNPNFSVPNASPSDFNRRMGLHREVLEEIDENDRSFHNGFASSKKEPKKNFMSPTMSSITKKKILAERKGVPLSDSSITHFDATPNLDAPSQITPLSSRARVSGDQNSPYDPITNYLSPRPEFLRYNPSRCRELLLRIEGEMKNGEGFGASSDLKELSREEESSLGSSASSQTIFLDKEKHESMENGTDAENDGVEEEEEEEEEEDRPWYSSMVWKLLLLFAVFVFSTCYISSMNPASLPSLQEFGGFQENLPKIRDQLPQREGNLSMFPGDILESIVGLPDKCLVVNFRELATGDEGIDTKLLVPDDLLKREGLEGESHGDILNAAHLGDSTAGDEGSNIGLLISDGLNTRVDSKEKESHDGIEVVLNGNDLEAKENEGVVDSTTEHDLLIFDELTRRVVSEEKGSHNGIELVAERDENMLVDSSNDQRNKNEEAVDSHDFLMHEQYDQRNHSIVIDKGNEKEEISKSETTMTENSALIGDSLQASQTQFVPDDSPTYFDSQLNLVNTVETATSSSEETQDFIIAEVTESSQIFQSQIVSSIQSDHGAREASEFSTISDIGLNWSISKDLPDQLFPLWICSLTAILGLLSVLYKYLSRSHQKPLLVSPPCSESAVEKKTRSAVSAKEEIATKGSESMPLNHSSDELKEVYAIQPPTIRESIDVVATVTETGFGEKLERRGAEGLSRFVPSNYAIDEYKVLYASRPPTVELLGELLVGETTVSDSGSGQRSIRRGDELLQFSSHSETRRSTRKNLSSSASKVYPYSSPEYVSNGSFTAQEKPSEKEDSGDIGEMVKVVTTTTPLRRSSRIRNRVTSP